jgi:hypothetical protein
MSDKELASLDAALAHVDPDRRKFLGILLAGVAAAPLLTSASLAAENKPAGQQGKVFPKTETSTKGSTAIKDGSNNTIKLNNQKTQTVKIWDKRSDGSNTQIKGENSTIKLNTSPIKGESPAIKGGSSYTIKSPSPALKLDPSTIKGANNDIHKSTTPALKYETQPIKGANSTIKLQPSAIKGENATIK